MPDWPKPSTPTGTTRVPNTEPSHASEWLAASWTVTIGEPPLVRWDQPGEVELALRADAADAVRPACWSEPRHSR